MLTEMRMYLNNEPADEEQLDLFGQVRVDQSIGLATEAELEIDLAMDDSGSWADIDTDFLQPFGRVRIEVKVNGGDFVPLIDGPVVGQRFELDAAPGQSRLTLVVHDDSVLLNRQEAVQVFEDQTASDVAQQLFRAGGLDLAVDDVPAAGGALERVIVQRGTAMQLLRDLARRHGMFVYVKPGVDPGSSVGVFAQPDLNPGDLPELLLMGADRNVNRLTIEFDALRPTIAWASNIDAADLSPLAAGEFSSNQRALGDEEAHEIVPPGLLLLARTREEISDLSAAAGAAVDYGSWAYSAQGEVTGDAYPAVLLPYEVVVVQGAGSLSGEYLVSQVTHTIDDEGYRQKFQLRRNARSTNGEGGLPGEVF